MGDTHTITDARELARLLNRLREDRLVQKQAHRRKRPGRRQLTRGDRQQVLAKTGGRCHVCGGEITEVRWQADHVLAHSGGGRHSVDNYLPAHALCNNYRWDYLATEFQYILKLGVWARTQIEKQTDVGCRIADGFTRYEAKRLKRRKD